MPTTFVPCFHPSLGNPKSISTFTSIENERNDLWIANTTNSSSNSNNWTLFVWMFWARVRVHTTHTEEERDSRQMNKWASRKYGTLFFLLNTHTYCKQFGAAPIKWNFLVSHKPCVYETTLFHRMFFSSCFSLLSLSSFVCVFVFVFPCIWYRCWFEV